MPEFHAVLDDVSLLKDSVSTISKLIGEGIFEATEEGLSFQAADRAIVAVVDFELDKDVFETYEVSGKVDIGINLDNLLQILRRAGSDDSLEMSLSEDGSTLDLKMVGDTVRRFSIPVLDIAEGETPSVDKLDFTTEFQVRTPVIEEGIKDASIVSDSLVVHCDGSELRIFTEGDTSRSELTVDEDGGLLSVKGDGARSRYPLDYLEKMVKAGKISDVASISFGDDFPMRLEFVDPERASMRFLLAPRVED